MRVTVLRDHPDYGATKTGKIYSHKSGKWKELKPQSDTDGYLQVRIFDRGRGRLTFVHRLVAETFIDNPNGYSEVNHVNGNKKDNRFSNLEWCTRSGNIRHAHDTGLVRTRTPISLTNIHTNEERIFKGQHEASRELGINQGNLNHALKRKNGTCQGYRVNYISDGDEIASY